MSLRQGNKVIAGHINYHPDLFDHKWADHLLNDVSWLRADTFSWQDGGVYEAAYDHLETDITGKSLSSETVSGITVQFYLADDGHKICPASEESNVAAIFTATGVAWYYIIDTTNEKFKLPRTKWGVTGLRGNVGDYVAQDVLLPNITGGTGGAVSNATPYGAFAQGAQAGTAGGGSGKFYVNTFDASRSSAVYGGNGSNTLIQPRGTQQYLYFYVGNFTQTALENTAGLNASLFNNKVDVGHEVIAFQAPTAQNNYTWYRKYADGWVEQGGNYDAGSYSSNIYANITYPIEMANTRYTKLFGKEKDSDSGWDGYLNYSNPTTTGVTVRYWNNGGSTIRYISWEVKGMAA